MQHSVMEFSYGEAPPILQPPKIATYVHSWVRSTTQLAILRIRLSLVPIRIAARPSRIPYRMAYSHEVQPYDRTWSWLRGSKRSDQLPRRLFAVREEALKSSYIILRCFAGVTCCVCLVEREGDIYQLGELIHIASGLICRLTTTSFTRNCVYADINILFPLSV
jgi:hypothetical protein